MLNDVKVVICGKEYKLRTAESPNYVYSLARALEAKINEHMNSGSGTSPYTAAIMVALSVLDDLNSLLHAVLGGDAAVNAPDALVEEVHGIVIGLGLNILGQGDSDSTGVGGVGQNAHGGDHVGHDLLGTVDTAPVLGNSLESVMSGDGQVVGLLHLLQNGVGLTGGIDIAGQQQHGDVVGSGGGSGSDHIGGAGAHGGGDGHDLLALGLLGEGDGDVGHALLVLALVDLHALGFLVQRLAHAQHAAVAGQHDHAFHKGMLHAVIGDILIFQESDQSLGHRKSYSFH